ncbi:MAG: hypothetical protein AB9891_06740 [Anaerolineaceae bacterium]
MDTENNNIAVLKVGNYSSWSLAILTMITFGFAMMAVPPAGPYCPGNCMDYPYPDILSYYPRDYYWLYLAVFQLCVFLIFMIANHFTAPAEKKIFSFISVAFAIISTTVLLGDYFLQFSVVPISVMKGQTEGIAILTQYNGHSIFIVLEELGFTMMSLAFLFLAPVFSMKNRLERTVRWILCLPFVVNIIAFIVYSIQFGLNRDYRFEVAAITINWLVTILIGILIGVFFKREMNKINLQRQV